MHTQRNARQANGRRASTGATKRAKPLQSRRQSTGQTPQKPPSLRAFPPNESLSGKKRVPTPGSTPRRPPSAVAFGRSCSTGRLTPSQADHCRAVQAVHPGTPDTAASSRRRRLSSGSCVDAPTAVTSHTTLLPGDARATGGLLLSPPRLRSNVRVYATTAAWRARTGKQGMDTISSTVTLVPPSPPLQHPATAPPSPPPAPQLTEAREADSPLSEPAPQMVDAGSPPPSPCVSPPLGLQDVPLSSDDEDAPTPQGALPDTPPQVPRMYACPPPAAACVTPEVDTALHVGGRVRPATRCPRIALLGHYNRSQGMALLPTTWYVACLCPVSCSASRHRAETAASTPGLRTPCPTGKDAFRPCCARGRLAVFRYSALAQAWPKVRAAVTQSLAQLPAGSRLVGQQRLGLAAASEWTCPRPVVFGVLWDSVASERLRSFQLLFNLLFQAQCTDAPALQWLLR